MAWTVKCYEDGEIVKEVPAKNKFDAGMKRDSLLGRYDDVCVFEDDDYIDPCEL